MAGKSNVIVGLGETGLSYARFLSARGEPFVVMDKAADQKRISELQSIAPGVEVTDLDLDILREAGTIYVSPGVPLSTPALQAARDAGAHLRGDVEMFGEMATAPVVAITGTNGKSTVAELVFAMAAGQKRGVRLAGNIGMPCLDVLVDEAELYVLELSSYQLELADRFPAKVAVVLNLSPDHLDRYADQTVYYDTKLKLYGNCESAVVNRELMADLPEMPCGRMATFGMGATDAEGQFGLVSTDDGYVLTHGPEVLVSSAEITLAGTHNLLNVLAALATGWLLNLDMQKMIEVAKSFHGLPHRSEFVAEIDGVSYINDSKATNPGAMIAAVTGQESAGNLHLIAGGVSKDEDFEGLEDQIASYVKTVYLIGDTREELAVALSHLDPRICDSLAQAVEMASQRAESGDVVMLSPGCASFDQFRNYAERGEVFRACVEGLRS